MSTQADNLQANAEAFGGVHGQSSRLQSTCQTAARGADTTLSLFRISAKRGQNALVSDGAGIGSKWEGVKLSNCAGRLVSQGGSYK